MEKGGLLPKKISHIMFASFGVLFVFFTKTGKELSENGNLQWTAGYVWQTLLMALVLGGILGILVSFVFYGLAVRAKADDAGCRQGGWRGFLSELRLGTYFWGSLLLILLAWLPAYLAYYPGICAYDFPIQMEQIEKNAYIDHHPIAHTMLIKGAWVLGQQVLGNVNAGIAVFTALQMIFLAGTMAWGLVTLHRFRVGIGYQIVMLFYCMFYPFHWYMSVSMTKDIIFSGFVLLFVTAMSADLLEDKKTLRISGRDVLLAVSCVGIVLFRNNGKYALLVLLVFLCLALWRGKNRRCLWGRLFMCCGTAFVIGNLLLSLLFSATGAQQGDKREMLSMPIQQLARVMIYHGGVGVLAEDDGTMDDVDRALINDFLLNEAYQYYQPEISDPVKRHTNTYVVRYRSVPFIKTYFHLLGQYPGEFINAALALDAGYVYPGDTSHAHVNEGEGTRNNGYVQTRWTETTFNFYGIYKASKWESLHQVLEKWADDNAYLNLPVLKYLFVPGTYMYLYLLLFGWLMLRRRLNMCLPLAFVMGYYVTLFLGPTVQLRYIYPVMLVLPFLALLAAGADHLMPKGERNLNGEIG